MKHMKNWILGVALAVMLTATASAGDLQKGHEAYADGDYAAALAEFQPLADLGNADALYFLGTMYANGEGVAQNYEEAARLFRQAADGGNTYAQNILGMMYDHGVGVPQNAEEAEQWFRRAAVDDFQKGLATYEAGDYSTAFAELAPLAKAGNAEAQFYLGLMYEGGEGVERNDTQAVLWYHLAAEAGLAEAQYNLGLMYNSGKGVAQDYAEAVKWWHLAAEGRYARAQYNLGLMYNSGKGVEQDYAEAVKWYRLAAEAGHVSAQNNLGVMYAVGRGVLQDYRRAYMWFNLAAAQGHEGAPKMRELTISDMTPEQLAEAQEMSAQCLANNYKNCK